MQGKIKDLPPEERPRERMYLYGPDKLSNAELLAILLRTGSRQESALGLARRILERAGSLRQLPELTLEELMEIGGIGPSKAVQIAAALELGRRLGITYREAGAEIRSPTDAARVLMEEMRFFNREYFRAVLLNTKNRVISIEDISVGSLSVSIVHPREVFRPAVRKSAASIILVHNHPSGDPTPSKEDCKVTDKIVQAGEMIGIKVLDHIILGEGSYYSFKEHGRLDIQESL